MQLITLLYEHIEYNRLYAPSIKNTSRLAKLIETSKDRLEKENINFSFKKLDQYNGNQDDLAVFIFELVNPDFTSCINELSFETIKTLKESKIPILLFLDSEGFSFTDRGCWIDIVQAQFTKARLIENAKFLCFGTGDMQHFYNGHRIKCLDFTQIHSITQINKDILLDSRKSPMTKCFGSTFFEYAYEFPNGKKFNEMKSSILAPKNKTMDFLCMNRNLRAHRLALVSELFRYKLNVQSLVSLTGGPIMPAPSEGDRWKVKEYMLKNSDQIKYFDDFTDNFKPIKISGQDDNLWLPPAEYYCKTFFSVVTETEYTAESFFLTEKTAKPITWLHPFIILGNPYTLKYLKSLGYETFPEMFDERYDEEESIEKRLGLIVDQIKLFCRINYSEKIARFQSIIDKLNYNRNVWDKRQENRILPILNMFKEIIRINYNVYV